MLIVPGYSEIETRQTIDTSVEFLGRDLEVPIISANMDYVTGSKMAIAMHNAGGMGILHRFGTNEDLFSDMVTMNGRGIPFYISVGTRDIDESISKIRTAAYNMPWFSGVCIDIAHGHHRKVASLIKRIRAEVSTHIIAGNVATFEGAKFVADAGADAIKVGIGAGAVCTTRIVAGVGVPQLTAILDAADADTGLPIIADGGIRGSADISKALIAGATVVMIGSVLAGATECPSPTVSGADGLKWRPYRGQSIFGSNVEHYVPEGIEGFVPDKGPVSDIIRTLQAGLKSSMSYVGANTINELQLKGKFTLVSSHTGVENSTRVRTSI